MAVLREILMEILECLWAAALVALTLWLGARLMETADWLAGRISGRDE